MEASISRWAQSKGFTGNIYTAFGSAIHAVCEQSALGNLEPENYAEYFRYCVLGMN